MIQFDYDPQLAAENMQRLSENGLSFMGVDVFDSAMLLSLIIRFTANFLVCWLITHFFYYPKSKRKDYYFTFILFSVTVFLLLFILQNLSIGTGFALGLFCIFGMIRYRTESIQIREMTYLFAIIGVSAINGLSVDVDYITVLFANILVLFITWILEHNVRQTATKIVLYERIALIVPEKYDELLADLKKRTGLNINKVEIGHIDFLRDVVYLKIYYQSNSDEINTIDHITKFS
jgi:tellurite resistance protein TehA-like permease